MCLESRLKKHEHFSSPHRTAVLSQGLEWRTSPPKCLSSLRPPPAPGLAKARNLLPGPQATAGPIQYVSHTSPRKISLVPRSALPKHFQRFLVVLGLKWKPLILLSKPSTSLSLFLPPSLSSFLLPSPFSRLPSLFTLPLPLPFSLTPSLGPGLSLFT